jgi:hypothetical protein
MVDGDHGHPRVPLTDLDLDSRFRERGVDRGIDGDRVVRVGSAAKRIIHINCQSCLYPTRPGESLTYSQETSTTTLNLLSFPASAMKSVVKNLGIGVAK